MTELNLTLDRSILEPGEKRTDPEIIHEWLTVGFTQKLAQGGSFADHLLWWEVEAVFKEAIKEAKQDSVIQVTQSQFRYIRHLLENLKVPASATKFFQILLQKIN